MARKTTGKGMGSRGKLGSKASQRTRARFKARVAAGKSGLTGGKKGTGPAGKKGSTISNYRAAQRAAVTSAAAKRNAAFQGNRNLSNLSTSQLVARDNAMYGNTFPSGAIGISEEGRAQAERQKSVQGRFMPSNPVYQGVGAYSGVRRYRDQDYLTAAPYINAFQQTFGPNATLKGNRFNPADRAAALGAGYTDSVIGTVNFAKNRLLPFGNKIPNIPTLPKFQNQHLEGLRNFGSVAIPGLQTFGALNRLSKVGLGQEISQMKLPNTGKYAFSDAPGAFRPRLTKTGIEGVSPLTIAQAFTPGMLKTGPTPGGSAAILGTATALSAAQQAKANETQTGGLNIGGGVDSGEGDNTARTLTARFNRPGFDTLAGGLDFVTNDRFDFDNSGRGLFGFGAVTPSNVINDAMSIAQNKNLTINDIGTAYNVGKQIYDSDNKFDTVKNILSNQDTTARLLGPVYDQLRNSEIVDSLATKKLNLPDNYGEQLDATKSALETAYNSLGDDKKENRKIISDLFIGKNPDLNLLKRAAEQFTNESGTIANYKDKSNLAKFQDSFNEAAPLFKGLNKDERGIKGSLGNWRLSNLGTKIVGRNLEGTNNFADLASNIIDTAGTDRATQSFLKTIGVKGAPTPQSLIKGLLPKFGSSAGDVIPNRSGSSPLSIQSGTAPEELLPILQLGQPLTQSGTTNSNLAQLQNQAYNNQMSLYGMNPNYFASFVQPSFNTRPRRFRQVFNRGYF